MALVINTNMASLNAQRHLSGSQSKLATAMERLSTGLRINSGKDDGAGLAIGSKLGATVRGLNQAVRNANDGISMAKAGDGALSEIGSMLDRMRELATQKGDGALSTSDKANISTEMGALATEAKNIVSNAKFNGNSLLSGSTSYSFQVGEASGDSYSVSAANITKANALSGGSSITAIESAIDEVTSARSTFGSNMTALESRASNSATQSENLAAARSQIMDADIAAETANMTQASVLQQAGISVLAQANQQPNMVLSLLR